MKPEISAFMDGELLEEETDRLLAALKRDDALVAQWTDFHVISDALKEQYSLRRELSDDFAHRMKKRLSQEPTVLSPGKPAARTSRPLVLSAAASVAAIAMVLGIAFYNETPNEIAQQSEAPAANQVDDYLMAHQEFSPSTMMQGVAPYMRTVSAARETE
jgi:sigma-E factor negative regulatory protein RseA